MTAAKGQPWGAMWRCLDTLRDLDAAALGDQPPEQCEGSELCNRWLVEALEAVLKNHTLAAEYLEHPISEAARALGVAE